MNHLFRLHCVFSVALLLLSGCGGSGIEKAIVSGKVSYQGEPVQDGLLRFVPIEGTKGPPSGAVIRDGTYTAKAINGVPLGKLRVEIEAFRKPADLPLREGLDLGLRSEVRVQYLPSKYNRQSELTVTLDSGGNQTRDFDLQ